MKAIYLSFFLAITFSSLLAQSPERRFYSSFRLGGWDICIAKEDAEEDAKFTEHPALVYNAIVTPDSRWVAFTPGRDSYPRLYIKSSDQKERARMFIKRDFMEDQSAISPDAKG